MSTLRPTRKISRREKLREDTVVTFYARAMEFLGENRTLVYGAAGALLVVIIGAFAFNLYKDRQQQQASSAVASAVRYYEQGDYQTALDGVPPQPGLVEVAREYGSTPAGNLARFYAADAHYRMGQDDEALQFFRAYEKGDDFLAASAYAGEAAILESRGDHAAAAALYLRAAEAYPSDVTTPENLYRAVRAYVAAGEADRARDLADRLKRDHADWSRLGDLDLLVARAGAAGASS